MAIPGNVLVVSFSFMISASWHFSFNTAMLFSFFPIIIQHFVEKLSYVANTN